jgi:hypothetical protein
VAGLINAADGTTLANYDYGAFGEPIRMTGAMAKNNPFRFSTKYDDDESDLLYYGYLHSRAMKRAAEYNAYVTLTKAYQDMMKYGVATNSLPADAQVYTYTNRFFDPRH